MSIFLRLAKPTKVPSSTQLPDTLSYTKLSVMCISSMSTITHFPCSGQVVSFAASINYKSTSLESLGVTLAT